METEAQLPPPTGQTGHSAESSSSGDEPPASVESHEGPVEDVTELGRVQEPELDPPRRTRRTRRASAPPPVRRTTGSLEKRLAEALGGMEQFPEDHPTMAGKAYYTGLAGAIYFVDQTDAFTIAMHSGNVAHAWAMLAEENAKVKMILERSLSGGAWGQAVLATLAMLLPIAANHGLLSGSILAPATPGPEAAQNGSEPGGSGAGSAGTVD